MIFITTVFEKTINYKKNKDNYWNYREKISNKTSKASHMT